MDSGNKLFLLDAYALIYRAYYASKRNNLLRESIDLINFSW